MAELRTIGLYLADYLLAVGAVALVGFLVIAFVRDLAHGSQRR